MRTFARLVAELSRRGGFAAGGAVSFALVAVTLFAVGLAPSPPVLAAAAPAVLWVTVLLAAVLSLEGFWHRPLTARFFDAVLMTGMPTVTLALAGIAAHWLVTGLPLLLAAAVLVPMLGLAAALLAVLLPSLAFGTFYLSALGAVAALLTHGARGAGLLLAVVVLPLMLPMLLLGLMAAARWMLVPAAVNPYLLWQAALVLGVVPLLAAALVWLLRAEFSR